MLRRKIYGSHRTRSNIESPKRAFDMSEPQSGGYSLSLDHGNPNTLLCAFGKYQLDVSGLRCIIGAQAEKWILLLEAIDWHLPKALSESECISIGVVPLPFSVPKLFDLKLKNHLF
jgi:hypothetical protein